MRYHKHKLRDDQYSPVSTFNFNAVCTTMRTAHPTLRIPNASKHTTRRLYPMRSALFLADSASVKNDTCITQIWLYSRALQVYTYTLLTNSTRCRPFLPFSSWFGQREVYFLRSILVFVFPPRCATCIFAGCACTQVPHYLASPFPANDGSPAELPGPTAIAPI